LSVVFASSEPFGVLLPAPRWSKKIAQIIGLCSGVKPWYKMSISLSTSESLSRQQERLIDAAALTCAPTFQG
jgi:hypothetical protein